jgi:hypothetical protein
MHHVIWLVEILFFCLLIFNRIILGTTPLGRAAFTSKGNPSTDIKSSLFKPGDRSILPRTPHSIRTGTHVCNYHYFCKIKPDNLGKSPWKCPYLCNERENLVYAFSAANGWTPVMEDRILVSCPLQGRPSWFIF